MPCKMCLERGKDWNGSDPKCAFEGPIFSGDNWNCATMNALRSLVEDCHGPDETIGWWERNDMDCASFGVVPFVCNDEKGTRGYLVMTWYKRRGCTGNALCMCDESRFELTEQIALGVLEYAHKEMARRKAHRSP